MSQFSSEVQVSNVVDVNGPLTDTELRATPVPVAGPLTDTELRATAVPVSVSGSVAVSNFPATQPISGAVSVSNFPATQPVSGPLTDTQLRATPVPVTSTPVTSNTANLSQVVLTTNVNATALAANASRKKVIIFAPKATLYIKLGTTASATSFTYIVTSANSTIEIEMWTGRIDVFSNVGQTINVTELV